MTKETLFHKLSTRSHLKKVMEISSSSSFRHLWSQIHDEMLVMTLFYKLSIGAGIRKVKKTASSTSFRHIWSGA